MDGMITQSREAHIPFTILETLHRETTIQQIK